MNCTGPPADGGWFRVDNNIFVFSEIISPTGLAVYSFLCRCANERRTCWPSMKAIGKACGLNHKTARRAILKLQSARLIAIERRRSANGKNEPNTYRLLPLPALPLDTPSGARTPARGSTPTGGSTPKNDRGILPETTHEQDSLNKTKPLRRALRFDGGDAEVARWMFDRVRALDPTAKEPNLDRWADTIRLMREKDGKSPDDIRDLFDRANRDNFWQANVLSPSKLREKWGTLHVKLRVSNGKASTNGHRPARVHQRQHEELADRHWHGQSSAGEAEREALPPSESTNGHG
jgi:hypothetical protein